MVNLTPKQLNIVRFVVRYRDDRGLAPTLEEIAQELGVSKITVYEHVAQLERKGAITKQKYQSRSIQVSDDLAQEVRQRTKRPAKAAPAPEPVGTEPYVLPLLGRIAAGRPIEAIEDAEPLDISDMVRQDRASYVLRVSGNSMIEDGIRNGDYVLIEKRTWASNGETVVAVIDDNEATLKRYYKEDGRIRLQPANASMEPIIVPHCEVRGIVVGLLRRY
jgi:repressor LexA